MIVVIVVIAVAESSDPAFPGLATAEAAQCDRADPDLVVQAAGRVIVDSQATSWVYPRWKACHQRLQTVAVLESVVSSSEVSE